MSRLARFCVILAALTVRMLVAQNSSPRPRDLYLEKVSGGSAAASDQGALGLRYTVLLVDPPTRQVREVDPDTVFHGGDCIAVEFTPNHDGALYVLNHGSSGAWQLLIPDPRMPDASSAVKAGVVLRVPTDYCFRLDGKPGTETLLLAITESQEDAAAMRGLLSASAGPANLDAIRDEVQSWQRLGSRDLKLEKIAQPQAPGERPYSVYAVTSSAAAANRLVIQIEVHHE